MVQEESAEAAKSRKPFLTYCGRILSRGLTSSVQFAIFRSLSSARTVHGGSESSDLAIDFFERRSSWHEEAGFLFLGKLLSLSQFQFR
jgi:hypothetical protein